MVVYSQRDPRWGAIKLGESGRPMAQIGCLVTSIAMLTTYFKPERTPADLATSLKFTPEGLVVWASCQFENFEFYQRVQGRDDRAIKFHISNLDLAVLLEVANHTHWVVGAGFNWFKGLYKIADPWYGDRADMARYKNDISGAAYFRRT